MIEDFHSLEELYKRVYPVLRMKVKEFQSLGYNNIKEEYNKSWKRNNNLKEKNYERRKDYNESKKD